MTRLRRFAGIASTLMIEGAAGAFWALVAVRYGTAGELGWPRVDAWAFPALLGLLAAAFLGVVLVVVRWRRPLGRVLLSAVPFLLVACATAGIKFAPPQAQVLAGALDGIVALLGLLAVTSLAGSFQESARPPWGPWITRAATLVPSLLLGGLAAGVGLAFGPAPPDLRGRVLGYLALSALGCLLLNTLVAFVWLKLLTDGPPKARTAADRVLDDRRGVLIAHLALAGAGSIACAVAAFLETAATWGLCAACACALASEALGAYLFEEAGKAAKE